MTKWLRYFEFFRRDPRRDIDDEISTHIEMRVTDLRARGWRSREFTCHLKRGIEPSPRH